MNINQQIENIAETVQFMNCTFKIQIRELEDQLKILEASVEQLELRLRNLRNEG